MSDRKWEPPTAGLMCRCGPHVLLVCENDEWLFPSGVAQLGESSWDCAKRQFTHNTSVSTSRVRMCGPRTFVDEARHKRSSVRIHLAIISRHMSRLPFRSHTLLHTVEWKTLDEARVLLSANRRAVLERAWPLLEEATQNDFAGLAFWIRFWFLLFCCCLYGNLYSSK